MGSDKSRYTYNVFNYIDPSANKPKSEFLRRTQSTGISHIEGCRNRESLRNKLKVTSRNQEFLTTKTGKKHFYDKLCFKRGENENIRNDDTFRHRMPNSSRA